MFVHARRAEFCRIVDAQHAVEPYVRFSYAAGKILLQHSWQIAVEEVKAAATPTYSSGRRWTHNMVHDTVVKVVQSSRHSKKGSQDNRCKMIEPAAFCTQRQSCCSVPPSTLCKG